MLQTEPTKQYIQVEIHQFPFGLGPVTGVKRQYLDGHVETLNNFDLKAEQDTLALLAAKAKKEADELAAKAKKEAEELAAKEKRQAEDDLLCANVAAKTEAETRAAVINAALRVNPDLIKDARAGIAASATELTEICSQQKALEILKDQAEAALADYQILVPPTIKRKK